MLNQHTTASYVGKVRQSLKFFAKRSLFPGLDLHTRCRYRFLPRFFRSGPIDTLDAGCGNGALAYAAYKLGNRVLGVTNNFNDVQKNRSYFSSIGADRELLAFEVCNLYDLPKLGRKFDQIICSETLEHIKQDDLIVKYFYDLLKDGGVLHICCPFSLHPEHHGHFDETEEHGWHVRDGYTLESYRHLLEPVGFSITNGAGLGSASLVTTDKVVRRANNQWGSLFAFPLFLASLPIQYADYLNPAVPYSLYIQAIKPSQQTEILRNR